jgi:hypothetical protein
VRNPSHTEKNDENLSEWFSPDEWYEFEFAQRLLKIWNRTETNRIAETVDRKNYQKFELKIPENPFQNTQEVFKMASVSRNSSKLA